VGQAPPEWVSAGSADLAPARVAAGEDVLRQERDAGFREGEAAGRAQAQAAVGPVLERLTRSIEELASLRPRLREQAEAELIRLAVAIARRVVRRELTLDPDAIAGLVKAALAQLAVHEVIRVRVHPEHEAAVRTCLAGDVEVTGDAALERGSAVFETVRGSLDASAETQLAEIERGLTDRLRSPR
jgi:flagellar assembly protein FliH